jgi:hypothetical protein
MVLNLDLAQTLLDFAGVTAPKEMQGRSWRPLLKGPVADWRKSWFYEYFAENQKNSRVPDITAVRTDDAKLILYPGHDEWSELFDLKADPFEMRNLFKDPSNAALRDRLMSAHGLLLKEVGYRVPDYVDRPPWWGLPGGPDALLQKPGLRLHYDFTKHEGGRVPDLSGLGNDGSAKAFTVVEGRDGCKALRLQGKGYVEVPKTKALNPADTAWSVEAVVKAEQPDGMILARGGKSQGYALWLKQGCPVFTVTVGNHAVAVESKEAVHDWAVLVGSLTAERKLILTVNGRQVGEARLPSLIESDPNDGMQIGADLGSPVVTPQPPQFSGLIERVRLFCGPCLPAVKR